MRIFACACGKRYKITDDRQAVPACPVCGGTLSLVAPPTSVPAGGGGDPRPEVPAAVDGRIAELEAELRETRAASEREAAGCAQANSRAEQLQGELERAQKRIVELEQQLRDLKSSAPPPQEKPKPFSTPSGNLGGSLGYQSVFDPPKQP